MRLAQLTREVENAGHGSSNALPGDASLLSSSTSALPAQLESNTASINSLQQHVNGLIQQVQQLTAANSQLTARVLELEAKAHEHQVQGQAHASEAARLSCRLAHQQAEQTSHHQILATSLESVQERIQQHHEHLHHFHQVLTAKADSATPAPPHFQGRWPAMMGELSQGNIADGIYRPQVFTSVPLGQPVPNPAPAMVPYVVSPPNSSSLLGPQLASATPRVEESPKARGNGSGQQPVHHKWVSVPSSRGIAGWDVHSRMPSGMVGAEAGAATLGASGAAPVGRPAPAGDNAKPNSAPAAQVPASSSSWASAAPTGSESNLDLLAKLSVSSPLISQASPTGGKRERDADMSACRSVRATDSKSSSISASPESFGSSTVPSMNGADGCSPVAGATSCNSRACYNSESAPSKPATSPAWLVRSSAVVPSFPLQVQPSRTSGL